jgi:hypothetical protein
MRRPLAAFLAEHPQSLYACADSLRDARRTRDGAHGVFAAHNQVRSLPAVRPNASGASPAESARFPFTRRRPVTNIAVLFALYETLYECVTEE